MASSPRYEGRRRATPRRLRLQHGCHPIIDLQLVSPFVSFKVARVTEHPSVKGRLDVWVGTGDVNTASGAGVYMSTVIQTSHPQFNQWQIVI